MLELAKVGVTNTYRVADVMASGRISVAKETAQFDGDGVDVRVERLDSGKRVCVHRDGRLVATATRINSLEYDLDGARPLELRKPTSHPKPFFVEAGGARLGEVSLSRFTGRKVRVDVPEDVSFEVRLLLGWICLRYWVGVADGR